MVRHNGHTETLSDRIEKSRPQLHQRSQETQPFGQISPRPIGLKAEACEEIVGGLNEVLANSMVLRDMYKKHHWQVSGHTFYQLHLLFDKHYDEQVELVDALAERIQILGGVSVALAHDVAEMTTIPRAPRGREEVPVQISRLLEAHEVILLKARELARRPAELGDDGTNDLIVSDVVRTNEMQVWFLSEHLVKTPAVQAD